jgi:hypothetical protein
MQGFATEADDGIALPYVEEGRRSKTQQTRPYTAL